jgi:hypothetical protein
MTRGSWPPTAPGRHPRISTRATISAARECVAGIAKNGNPRGPHCRVASATTSYLARSLADHVRHRLSRAGNRQINRVLHIMAVVQLRHATKGRAYDDRKIAAGKTPMEAMRALKRRLSGVVFRQMMADARRLRTGPGGRTGAATISSAAGSDPMPALRISHFPDRPPATLRPFSRLLPPPALRASPQPLSSGLRLTAARTGAHSARGNNRPLDTEGSLLVADDRGPWCSDG